MVKFQNFLGLSPHGPPQGLCVGPGSPTPLHLLEAYKYGVPIVTTMCIFLHAGLHQVQAVTKGALQSLPVTFMVLRRQK